MTLSRWCVMVDNYHPHFPWRGRLSYTHPQGPTVRSRVKEGDRNTCLLESTGNPLTCTKEGMWSVTLAMNMNLFGNLEKAIPNACPSISLVSTNADSLSLSGTWPFREGLQVPM